MTFDSNRLKQIQSIDFLQTRPNHESISTFEWTKKMRGLQDGGICKLNIHT